jgi:hypothetical protein
MSGVAEYLGKAIGFEALAACAGDPSLKRRYADLAGCYRLLAEERLRLATERAVRSDEPKDPN